MNKGLNNVTIIAPEQSSEDLTAAEEAIKKHLGDLTLKTEEIVFSEPILGLLFALEPEKQHLTEKFVMLPGVSVRFLKPPQIGVSINGIQSAIDAAKPKAQQILAQLFEDISQISFSVASQYSVLFGSGEFSHFLTKLKTDHAVVCTFPTSQPKMNKTIHSIPIKPTASAHSIMLEIVEGNIVNESADALVNAANEKLDHIGGLAKVILDAGGPSIQAESDAYIKAHGAPKVSDALCLSGGNLPCKKVIHAVGPRWTGGNGNEETMLYFTIQNILRVADKESLGTIALPAIGCGVFKVPEDICARATLKSIRDYCQATQNSNIRAIRCVLYDQPALRAFCKALQSYFPAAEFGIGQLTTCTVQWQWQDDNGCFVLYSTDIADELSDCYDKDPTSKFLYSRGRHTYRIDFSTMLQTNIATNKQRKIQCIPLSQPTLLQAQWCYRDDSGQFVPYKSDESSAIHSMYLKKVPGILVMGNNASYTFDFNTMHQINIVTNFKRRIKFLTPSEHAIGKSESSSAPSDSVAITLRGPKRNLENAKSELLSRLQNSFSKKTVQLPPGECGALEKKLVQIAERHHVRYSFSSITGGKGVKEIKVEGLTSAVLNTVTALQEEIIAYQSSSAGIPPEWQPQKKTTELFQLTPGSQEWNDVVQKFQLTMPQTRINSVQRIQNTWLWDRYVKHRERLKLKNDGVVNEMELFHGTRDHDPRLIYEGEDGFDMRYSADGMWGRANYFAKNASYSDGYAHCSSGQKQIFLVMVLTGESCNCVSDRSLRMPPPMPTGRRDSQLQLAQRKYDTVTGTTGGSHVFMTYDNEKAYPAYLITYTNF